MTKELLIHEKMPHEEYEEMCIEIENNLISIEIKNGNESVRNSRVSLSFNEFEKIAAMLKNYRLAYEIIKGE